MHLESNDIFGIKRKSTLKLEILFAFMGKN